MESNHRLRLLVWPTGGARKSSCPVSTRGPHRPKRCALPTELQLVNIIKTAIAAAETAKAKRLEARAKKKREQMCNDLKDKVTAALNRALLKVIDEAQVEVNTFAPADIQLRLDPDDYAWLTVGKDGRPHDRWLMCGTERASTVLSLAAAWSMPLGILWIDDDDDLRGIDPVVRREHLLRLASQVKEGKLAQVIVLSCWPEGLPDWPAYDADQHATNVQAA